ncbi:MAG: ABC transporter permease [Oligoflexia bacterium]|nr:ABC transporter permease [Oligoflexia bacterium]
MLELWWAYRSFFNKSNQLINPVTFLSLFGMVIGVAALIIVMSVISGFQTSLSKAVTDISGHLLVIKRGEAIDKLEVLLPKIKKAAPSVTAATPFVHVEAMIAAKGKISGVVIQGLDLTSYDKVFNLQSRVIEGEFDLSNKAGDEESIIIGKGLRDKLNVKLGDIVSLVLPKNSAQSKRLGFVPQVKKFKIVAVVDLGMYEYDSRYIITSSVSAQNLASIGPFFTGLRLTMQNPDLAPRASFDLSAELGYQYLVKDWVESHYNLFQAIKLEKIVIFIVLLFITIAACFNIASTLFISVIRKTQDIAIMKAFGTNPIKILKFFSFQGMILGFLGCVLGIAFGLLGCLVLNKTNIFYVPPEIYHLSHLPVDIRWLDIMVIFLSCMILCFLSTLAPALKASRLLPVQGLRHE